MSNIKFLRAKPTEIESARRLPACLMQGEEL